MGAMMMQSVLMSYRARPIYHGILYPCMIAMPLIVLQIIFYSSKLRPPTGQVERRSCSSRTFLRSQPAHQRCDFLHGHEAPDVIWAMQEVKPDILVKGIDYISGIHAEHAQYCRDHGIEIRLTDTPKISAWEMLDAARRG